MLPNSSHTYKYIIVGGGTSGCVLANQLSLDGTVLVLETGVNISNNITVQNPITGWNNWYNQQLCKTYLTTPIDYIDSNSKLGSQLIPIFSVGRTLGGNSLNEYSLYVRGSSSGWNNVSNAINSSQWNYNGMLPYFIAMENFNGISQTPSQRGTNGPIVIRQENTSSSTLTNKIINSLVNVTGGLPKVTDYNTSDAETCVCSNFQFFQSTNGSSRSTTVQSYLSSPNFNVTVSTGCYVKQILFINNQAKGVIYETLGKQTFAYCSSKVIIASGSLSSTILMRSGIGSFALLKSLNLPQLVNNPNVGINLQTQVGVQMILTTNNINDITNCTISPMIPSDFGIVSVAFLTPQPNINNSVNRRWMFLVCGSMQFLSTSLRNTIGLTSSSNVIHLICIDLTPSSRGQIYPVSGQTNSEPVVQTNLLSTSDDLQNAYSMLNFLYSIYQNLSSSNSTDGIQLIWPPISLFQNGTQQSFYDTIYSHPFIMQNWIGTCSMAQQVQDGVVDQNLHVYGVQNLMVCDSSILPVHPGGFPMAATIAIALKGASIAVNTPN